MMGFGTKCKDQGMAKKGDNSHSVFVSMIVKFIPQLLAAETDKTETATTLSTSLSVFLCLSVSVICIAMSPPRIRISSIHLTKTYQQT